jgi:hypothetical protein
MVASDIPAPGLGPREPGSSDRAALVRACAAAFVASFCTLVIELVAARLMAP